MAYVRECELKDGTRRFTARYLGADGKYHEERGFASRREAEKAAAKREVDATRSDWASPAASRIPFSSYVEDSYWPTTAHLEISTRAAYRYYLDKHFLPRFGEISMRRISPPMIQTWVNDAAGGLSARSVVKYHALLHKIFSRAVIDRAVPVNPCTHTALAKAVRQPRRIITVEQFDKILANIPAWYRTMVLLAVETGLRWGELIALRPADVDLKHGVVLVRRTIVEVARKNSPNRPADDYQGPPEGRRPARRAHRERHLPATA
jgi:integrase